MHITLCMEYSIVEMVRKCIAMSKHNRMYIPPKILHTNCNNAITCKLNEESSNKQPRQK